MTITYGCVRVRAHKRCPLTHDREKRKTQERRSSVEIYLQVHGSDFSRSIITPTRAVRENCTKTFHSSSQEKAVFRRGLANTEFHEEIISGKSSFHSYCVDPSKTRFSRSTPWTYPCLKSTHLCPISKTQKSTYLLHTLAWEKLISTIDCPSPDLRCLPPIKFVPPKKRRHQDLRCKPQPSPSKPARCFRLPSYLVSASLRHSCAANILRHRTTSVRAPFFRSSRQSRASVHYYRLHPTPRGVL